MHKKLKFITETYYYSQKDVDKSAYAPITKQYVTNGMSPAAMLQSLQQLTQGHLLAAKQQDLLLIWLKNNTTGDSRIRAGVPNG